MAPRAPVIHVRRAHPGDAEAIMAVFSSPRAMAGTLQLPYPSAELWRKRLTDQGPEDFLLVAEVKGEVVGNLGLHPAGRARRRHAASIGMSVRDDWQQRGVGTALLIAGLDVADHWLNYVRIELTVYTDNVPALALYRKFGFGVEGTLISYAYRNGRYVDAYAMARLRAGSEAPTMAVRQRAQRKATKTTRKRSTT
ncbi:MAG: GNAT family N-acetyltransferase [Betaproteobacteria bacterium]